MDQVPNGFGALYIRIFSGLPLLNRRIRRLIKGFHCNGISNITTTQYITLESRESLVSADGYRGITGIGGWL